MRENQKHYLQMITNSRLLIKALRLKRQEYPTLTNDINAAIKAEQDTVEYYKHKVLHG